MNYLLPNHFKKIGALMAPLGFGLWSLMQFGYVAQFLNIFFDPESPSPALHIIRLFIGAGSFFSFLIGMYFIAFSKEKIEDEMVQRTRVDSFQFAALIQMVFIILGFTAMILFKEPENDGGLALFFMIVTFLFWLSFVARFNYILHLKLRQ